MRLGRETDDQSKAKQKIQKYKLREMAHELWPDA